MLEFHAVGQVTIYLDDENEKRVKAAAKAAGMPVSRWLATLVQEKTCDVWPEQIRLLAGAWQDFPDVKTIRQQNAKDSKRETV